MRDPIDIGRLWIDFGIYPELLGFDLFRNTPGFGLTIIRVTILGLYFSIGIYEV
jgi:hypothetical protein